MAISQHLLRKLEEVLGLDASEDLVTQLHDIGSLRADFAELRHDMNLGFAKLDAKLDTFRAELRAEIATQVAQNTATLLKWSFVFWVGAVAAIAALAGVLK